MVASEHPYRVISIDDRTVEPPDDPFQLLKRVHAELQTLNGLDVEKAASLRRELFARPIDSLSVADLARVQALIAASRPAPAASQQSYIDRDYGAYLDAIPHGRALLEDIEALAGSRSFAELVRRSERVFVDRLGFGAGRVDETARLHRSEIARVEKIGQFREFSVVCVELTRPNWYADFYSVVFRFHPYALVLSLEPNARALRFVFRRDTSARPEYRSLTGPHTDWEPNDNILVWAWRLHRLRPRIDESFQTLHRRVTDALSRPPEELGADWPSIRFPCDQSPPGVPWVSAARRAFESFLQLDTPPAERRRWGLEAVLRDRFPIELPHAGAIVEYVGYDVAATSPGDADVGDRERAISLHLAICQGERREPLDVMGCLPEPDDDGRFVLEGIAQRFSAVVGTGGRLAAFIDDTPSTDELPDDDPDDHADDADHPAIDADNDESGPSATTAATPADELSDGADTPRRASRPGFRGLSPRAFLEYAVSRRFAGVASTLRRAHVQSGVPLREHVHLMLLRSGHRIDRLPLAAIGVLRSFLRPDTGVSLIHSKDWRVAATPPSWCCLDLSAGLSVGAYVPIAGARMHPTGSLAVPVLDGASARLVLSHEPAHAMNGRIGGRAPPRTRAWWISGDLSRYAELPAGQLECAELAGRADAITAWVVTRNGPRQRAWVSRALALPRRQPRHLAVRLPAVRSGEPTIVVQVGTHVEAGDVWLHVPERTWSMAGWETMGIERLADEVAGRAGLAGEPFAGDPRRALRIPAGIAGRVTHTAVEPVAGLLETTAGWMARMVVQPTREAYGTLHAADGRAYPIAGVLARDDAPFDEGGEVVDVVLEDPRVDAQSGEVLFDPRSEAAFHGQLTATTLHFAASPVALSTPPERYGQLRLFDREGIPGHALSPAFTERERLRWWILDPATSRFEFELDGTLPVPTWVRPFRDAARAAGLQLDHELTPATPPSPEVGDPIDPIATRIHKRPVEQPEGAVRELARAVLHPWGKPAAAALLGVTLDELDLLVRRHGLTPVIEALRAAAATPEEAALQRLERVGSRERQQALGEGLLALRRVAGIPELGALVLTALPVPSVRLVPYGIPAGASRALQTPLLVRYRQVELASELCRELACAVEEIRVAADVELQAAVDALFGDLDAAKPRGDTLAGWLARAWPLTRAPDLRTSCDDLTWAQDADGRPVPAVWDGDALVCPPPRVEVRAAADPTWWIERSARAWLLEQQSAWFLGLFASLDVAAGPRPATPLDAPPDSRGAWAAREWVRRLELPESRPSQLVRMLTRTAPLRLASNGLAARGALEPVLLAALPGLDAGGQQLRVLLTEILCGFWNTVPGTDAPIGWVWLPVDSTAPRGGRYLPPLEHRAWTLWSWTMWASSAPRLALALATGQCLPALLRVVCGFPDAPQLPVPTSVELPSIATLPETEALEESALPVPPVSAVDVLAPLEVVPPVGPPVEEDIVVTRIGLREWLAQTRSEVSL